MGGERVKEGSWKNPNLTTYRYSVKLCMTVIPRADGSNGNDTTDALV